MKILLTGGAGFIATHTCVELMAAGHDVVVVDNYVNSQPEALRRVEEIAGRPVKAYEADVCDRAAMDKIFSENRFDAVIHFAGLKAVGESVHKPLEYYRNNLDSTLTLCETMRRHGCKRLCSRPLRRSTVCRTECRCGRICSARAARIPTAGRST